MGNLSGVKKLSLPFVLGFDDLQEMANRYTGETKQNVEVTAKN